MIHMQLLCMSLCGVIVCLCASACVLICLCGTVLLRVLG